MDASAEHEKGAASPSKEHHGHGHHQQHDFKLENLDVHFSACLHNDGLLCLDEYIAGYDELYKFLNLLGTVFGWVASDVHAKLEVLRAHRLADKKEHYATIQGMLEYEVKEDMIKPNKAKDASNGSRNLLRLHRALEYITHFLECLPGMDSAEKCCHVSQTAYKETLMKYHPWVVQKAALMAMHMLPTKEGLIHKICGDSEDEFAKAVEALPKAVAAMKAVYDKTQEVYRKYELLDLP